VLIFDLSRFPVVVVRNKRLAVATPAPLNADVYFKGTRTLAVSATLRAAKTQIHIVLHIVLFG
jgi:hypothetical protein